MNPGPTAKVAAVPAAAVPDYVLQLERAAHYLPPEQLPARFETPLILQLELPIETVEAAVGRATGFVCANLAPAAPVSELLLRRADLIVVNETEAAFYGDGLHRGGGRVVVTKGARGAAMYQRGVEMAWASPPAVEAVDATGAGDAFNGGFAVALSEGRDVVEAVRFGCATAGISVTRAGTAPSMPARAEIEALLAKGA